MSAIEQRCSEILQRVAKASGERQVLLIGVTKTISPEQIVEAHRAGIGVFGENRIQEALPKIQALSELECTWHFIGHLQSNKARDAVRHFSMIHSIDSERLLIHVSKEAEKQGKDMDVLLELNLGGEESKSGMAETEVPQVLQVAGELRSIRVRGLMIVPPFLEDPEAVRPFFRKLRELRDRLQPDFPDLTELSMGMSHDFEVALEEGATMVRIGTALFGPR